MVVFLSKRDVGGAEKGRVKREGEGESRGCEYESKAPFEVLLDWCVELWVQWGYRGEAKQGRF